MAVAEVEDEAVVADVAGEEAEAGVSKAQKQSRRDLAGVVCILHVLVSMHTVWSTKGSHNREMIADMLDSK